MNKTIAKVGYAPLKTSGTEVSYENIVWFESAKAGGREISAEPQGELEEYAADGITALQFANNGGYQINLTLLDIIDDVETAWLGNVKNSDGTIVEVADAKVPPRFALVVAKEALNSEKIYDIDTYFNCIAQRPSRNAKTSEPDGKLDLEFPQFTISARPLETNKLIVAHSHADELPEEVTIPSLVAPVKMNTSVKVK